MNGKEFIKAVDLIEKEKGIDREIIFQAMEAALMAAYKKNFDQLQNVKVVIDKKTGDIKVYSYLTVVPDEKEDDEESDGIDWDIEISLTEARKINKTLQTSGGSNVSFDLLAGALGEVLNSNVYVVSDKGKVLG